MATGNSAANRNHGLVSVIIPCFNRAKWLDEAIRSVLRQTYTRFELIVVDDGSTDDTAKVAKSHSKVVCIQQQNQGVSHARNNGFQSSSGEFVLFLDSDDRLLPNALEVGIRCMKDPADYGFVSGHIQLIDAAGHFLSRPEESCIVKDHYLALLRSNYIWTPSSVLFRSSFFRSTGGFRSSLSAGADWDIYLRIARAHPVHCHDDVVAEYRVHDNSMNADRSLMLSDSIRALQFQKDYLGQNPDYREAYRHGIRGIQKYYGDPLIEDVKQYRLKKDWRCLANGFLTLLRYYPTGVFRTLTKV